MLTVRPMAQMSKDDRQRMRRVLEKKRIEQMKKIHESFKSISKSEVEYIQSLRDKFEPKITYPDVKDDDDETVDT